MYRETQRRNPLKLPMKRRTIIILTVFVVTNVLAVIAGLHWRTQKQQRVDEMIRHAERYAGATGDTITIFDNRTDRWITEMKEESVEATLQKLTDAAEYMEFVNTIGTSGFSAFETEYLREKTHYSEDIEVILSNRRFRKAFDDLQKTDRKKAAELLTENIRENLAALRIMLQENQELVSRGKHKGGAYATLMVIPDDNSYRYSSHPDYPPTQYGRRYAVLAYILLASLFELREVRPAVEETVQLAKEEYKFFNSVHGQETDSFKSTLLDLSLYNPSLLMTATLCDPTWDADKHKRFEAKLVKDREAVDWQSRALEHDRDAKQGWIPVVPHDGMLKIRYYKGITDADFNDFFGK